MVEKVKAYAKYINTWPAIIGELLLIFALVYVSVFQDWPQHELIKFMLLVPLYQAGVTFGFKGGIIGGMLATLLFIPSVPMDSIYRNYASGPYNATAMIVFINIFGIFVGTAIGRARQTRDQVNNLTEMFLTIGKETSEHGVMRNLAREARVLFKARYAVYLIEDAQTGLPSMACFMEGNAEEIAIQDYTEDHPLFQVAREREGLFTRNVASDTRFQTPEHKDIMSAILAAPVFHEDRSCGAVMVADRLDDEPFTTNALNRLELLAGAAGASIHVMEQERTHQQQAQRERRIKDLFSRFVSSSVADYVLDHPDLLRGRWQEVTLLVSDIRGFTSMSESMAPSDIVSQLNEYFTAMVDIVFEHKGTIDKFIGDCIIAYWGAPLDDPNQADNAARTAMDMARALDELNRKWEAENKRPFNTGIGLHTCKVLIGNIGDDRKKAYTIMGEQVRHAMTMESLTKNHGVRIILSQSTRQRIGSRFSVAELPALDGVSIREPLFQLVGD